MPEVEKLGPGLWVLPVPIPDNPLGWTSVYLLDSDTGPHLVDAGWDDPRSWDALCDGLVEAGTSIEQVRGVVVTHHHPDHHGLAGRVREASGAWVALHERDAALVRQYRTTLLSEPGVVLEVARTSLTEAGAAPDEVAQALETLAQLRVEIPVLADRELVHGQLADVPGRQVRVLHTPGHTPGHVCLHLEDEDRLLSGDHLLVGITPHVGIYDLSDRSVDPLQEYLDSLRQLAALDPFEVLPAHRARFEGAGERAAELVEHHEERLDELAAIVAEQPLTAWELCGRLTWNRPWREIPLLMRRVALAEVLAHVRLLDNRGAVMVDAGPPVLVRAR